MSHPLLPRSTAADAITTVRSELARAESKASALLGIAGAALTVILAAQTLQQLPLAAMVIGAVATVTDAAVIALLTWSLLPRLTANGGWLAYADLHPWHARIRLEQVGADDVEQLVTLARIARGKYRVIRMAVLLLLAVLVLVLAAASAAVVGQVA